MARLNRLDWLDHGLRVLAQSGPDALKAEPLAKSLNVSRGSFYWHFQDIEAFHAGLLGHWRERATKDIIAMLGRETSPNSRLGVLIRLGMSGDNRLERSMRSWAAQSKAASGAVASVDEARIGYLSRLLRLAGIPQKQARARATFIYWAYLGRIMLSKEHGTLSENDLDLIAGLLQS